MIEAIGLLPLAKALGAALVITAVILFGIDRCEREEDEDDDE